ncbi:MAG: AAA family ATPase [Elusimicrobia bacterium]|nr:AAA family ATPase [Elusimicrobiota bacterium]
MRLKTLKVGRLGALKDVAITPQARVSLLCAPNESGKTTLIDALRAALFGVPPATKAEGKEFRLRYEGSQEGLAADVEKEDAEWDAALVERLLFIRSGEAGLGAEDGFIDRFAARVLGSGLEGLSAAMEAMKRVTDPPRSNSAWKAVPAKVREELADYERRLEKVAAGDAAAGEQAALESLLTAKKAEERRAKDDLTALAAAGSAARRRRLSTLKAEIEEAVGQLSRLRAPARAELGRVRALQEAARKQDEAKARLAAAKAELEDAKAERAACADPAALTALRDSLEEAARREAARDAAGAGLPAWLPLAAAVGGALLVWLPTHSPVGALVAGAVLGIAAFALLRGSGGGRPAAEAAAALSAVEARRDALGGGWVGLARGEARARLDAEAARAAKAEAAAAGAEKRLQEARGQAEGSADGDLSAALKSAGCATVEALEAVVSEREGAEAALERARKAARAELGADLKPSEDIGVALRRAMDELERSAAEVPEAVRGLSPEEAEKALKRTKAAVERLAAEREALDRRLSSAVQAAAQAKDQSGLSAAALELKARKARRFLKEVDLYRLAAEAARAELEALYKGTDRVLRDCLAEASAILSRLSEGRYSGLQVGAAALDDAGFSVAHKTLGRKPFGWLSRGARDTVWLAMRLAMAKQAFPKGAFLVLDEPFHHLDPQRTLGAMRALSDEALLPGWQVLIFTKDAAAAQALQDAGLIPSAGRLSI